MIYEAKWERCRNATPGCKHVVHFNNAGAALQPQAVVDAVQAYTAEEALHGGYETAARRETDLQRPYTALAQLLNCTPQEIAILSSATSAWGQVFFGIPFKQGDIILTSQAEYGSNYLAYLQAQKRSGVVIQVIPETADGDIDIPALRQMLAQQPKPALVSISHIPTSSGRVYDAAAVGAETSAAGVPYLLDACQSAGQMPLDVQQLRCDFLTGTSRKYLRGPRGIGFLYARTHPPTGSTHSNGNSNSSISSKSGSSGGITGISSSDGSGSSATAGWEPAMIDIHGAEWLGRDSYSLVAGAGRYEQYELNTAAKVGFGVAVSYCLQQDLKSCWQRTQQLAARLRQRLAAEVPGLVVQDRGRVLCGIVSFTVKARPAAGEVKAWLGAQEPPINVSMSAIGSTRLDFEARGLEAVVRASVAYYNTEGDLDALVAALQRLVQQQQQQVPQEQARTGPGKHEVSAGCQGPGVSSRPGGVGVAAGSSEAGAVAGSGTPQLKHESRGLQRV